MSLELTGDTYQLYPQWLDYKVEMVVEKTFIYCTASANEPAVDPYEVNKYFDEILKEPQLTKEILSHERKTTQVNIPKSDYKNL